MTPPGHLAGVFRGPRYEFDDVLAAGIGLSCKVRFEIDGTWSRVHTINVLNPLTDAARDAVLSGAFALAIGDVNGSRTWPAQRERA